MTKRSKTMTLTRDPVCGMSIVPSAALARAKFKGVTYYFDSAECARKFEADPEDFLNPPEVA